MSFVNEEKKMSFSDEEKIVNIDDYYDDIFRNYSLIAKVVTKENLKTANILASCITDTNDEKEQIKRINNLLYHYRDTISKLEKFYKNVRQLSLNFYNAKKKQLDTIHQLDDLYQSIALELSKQLLFLARNSIDTDIIKQCIKQCIESYFSSTTINNKQGKEQREKFLKTITSSCSLSSNKTKATDDHLWLSKPGLNEVNIILKKKIESKNQFGPKTKQARMIQKMMPEMLEDIQTRWSDGDIKTEEALEEMKAFKNSFGDLVEIPKHTGNIYKHLYRRMKLTKKIEANIDHCTHSTLEKVADKIEAKNDLQSILEDINYHPLRSDYKTELSKSEQRVLLLTAMVYLLKGKLKGYGGHLDIISSYLFVYIRSFKFNINPSKTRFRPMHYLAGRDGGRETISYTLVYHLICIRRSLTCGTNNEESYRHQCLLLIELLGKIGRQSVAFLSWSFFKSTPKRLFEETKALLKQESEEIEAYNRVTT